MNGEVMIRDNPAPPTLGEEGQAVWRLLVAQMSWAQELDLPAIQRFCELLEERSMVRRALVERGVLLEEVLVSPNGQVVGTRVVANPALKALHGIDQSLDAILTQLGISPSARAKIGLAATDAEIKKAEIERVLNARYRHKEEV